MTAAEFVRRRQQDWNELERLLRQAGKRGRKIKGTPAELSRFADLFRNACADLARARALDYPDSLVDYLNGLAARSHNLFYAAPPPDKERFWRFFTAVFPALVRRNVAYVAAALLLFYGPLAAMVGLATHDPEALYQIVPQRVLKQMEQMHSGGHQAGRSEDQDVAMTGFYVRNNVGIAFQCFASGVFFGLGSLLVLLFNGITIGATMGYVGSTASGMNLLSFIAGHGPLELTAICLSGAAGLRLGFGPIITGNRSRGASLRRAGADAVRLVLGAAVMLLLAALIEGFFSPSSLPAAVKFGFGGCTVLLLVWYLALYRRRELATWTASA